MIAYSLVGMACAVMGALGIQVPIWRHRWKRGGRCPNCGG